MQLESGTFKVPTYNEETRSFPMEWNDLVMLVRIIEFTPGKLYVRDIIRPKYALLQCEDDTNNQSVVIAKMPLLPINKAMAGASLLAEVIQKKYSFHLPFYRQIQQFKQLGIKLSSSTINAIFSVMDMLHILI